MTGIICKHTLFVIGSMKFNSFLTFTLVSLFSFPFSFFYFFFWDKHNNLLKTNHNINNNECILFNIKQKNEWKLNKTDKTKLQHWIISKLSAGNAVYDSKTFTGVTCCNVYKQWNSFLKRVQVIVSATTVFYSRFVVNK